MISKDLIINEQYKFLAKKELDLGKVDTTLQMEKPYYIRIVMRMEKVNGSYKSFNPNNKKIPPPSCVNRSKTNN